MAQVIISMEEYETLKELRVPYVKANVNGRLICTVDCNELEQMIAIAEERGQQVVPGSYTVSSNKEVEVNFINA